MILEGDIPEGSEAAIRLLRSNNLKKILDMVSYDARSTTYMQCLTKCFANISQLGVLSHLPVCQCICLPAVSQGLPLVDPTAPSVERDAGHILVAMRCSDRTTRFEIIVDVLVA